MQILTAQILRQLRSHDILFTFILKFFVGMCAAIGAAVPLLVFHLDEASQKEGIYTWIGLLVGSFGLYCLAKSGSLKEKVDYT